MADDIAFKLETEGDNGNLRAVLVFTCPKCSCVSRSVAVDEGPDGALICSCGQRFVLSGDRLSGVQANLDGINKSIRELADTFRSLRGKPDINLKL